MNDNTMLSQQLKDQQKIPFKSTTQSFTCSSSNTPLTSTTKEGVFISGGESEGDLQAWHYLKVFRNIKPVSD